MSPKEARVFIIEDDPRWQRRMKKTLERAGHLVVATASTMDKALNTVSKLSNLKVNVVTIDGNLGNSGTDGQDIVEVIRKQAPSVRIVGMSENLVRGVDVNVGKGNFERLAKTVTNL